jgi:endonuclease G
LLGQENPGVSTNNSKTSTLTIKSTTITASVAQKADTALLHVTNQLKKNPVPLASTVSEHLTMGNPSAAKTNINQPTNYLMEKNQYALSYNRDKGEPNWVSWHLDSAWLGGGKRGDDFRSDPALPTSWYKVKPQDYTASGFDKGHMAPSGDRTLTTEDNSSTFLMTNMIPQAPRNNQGPWADLEAYCRDLVKQGNELYVVSGGSGESGKIGNGRVTVPTHTWKVIIILPKGTNDVSRVTAKTRTIAVWMPNQNSLDPNWRNHRVNVDFIEQKTGFDFFSSVNKAIQGKIEAVIDKQA